MAFVKLDCGILTSTTWMEKDVRDMFITALLMAVPHELIEPEPEIEINSLDATGWTVPPGWYGFVHAAGPGIARMALVDKDKGLAALEILRQPEPESRTQDFDGRRMVRVNGGFIVLNFQKYRDKDHTAAERQRRYRERQKSVTLRRDVTSPSRNVTQAEAEAEAEGKDISPNGLCEKPKVSPVPYQKIIDLYHEILPRLPKVAKLSEKRKRAIRSRWKGDADNLDYWRQYFRHAASSKFLHGQNDRGWIADIDFMIREDVMIKMQEGKYHG